MSRKIARTFASFALALVTASSLVACDGGDEPVQTVEKGVSEEGVQLLLQVADLDEAADFAIYTLDLPQEEDGHGGFQIGDGCILPTDAAVESSCGWCGCDPVTGNTVCIDYQCNPKAYAEEGDLPLANGHADPQPELGRADGASCSPGTAWESDCNVCSCNPDGTASCTLMVCDSNPF